MSANPKHRTSDTPCKKCQSRERYKSTRNCVGCAKNAVRRKRGQLELPNQPLADSQPAEPLLPGEAELRDKIATIFKGVPIVWDDLL